MTYKRHRTDANHTNIVTALRKCGALVCDLSSVGNGCQDLLVCTPHHRRLVLVEIKDGSKSPSRRKLTDMEQAFHNLWPVSIIKDVDEAVKFLNSLSRSDRAHVSSGVSHHANLLACATSAAHLTNK